MPKLRNTSSQNNEFMFYSDITLHQLNRIAKKIVCCYIKIFLNAYPEGLSFTEAVCHKT